MKFCDKLPKLRKENNLSQEQLADKVGVSRQAVSKWESGSSYPDMEKMLLICNILNCTLEDLMDDGSFGKTTQSTKINFNNILNDFLKFITKSYNMICSMKFKEKIKCFFELSFIFIILFLGGLILFSVLANLTNNIVGLLPHVVYHFLSKLFSTLYLLILIIIGILIFIHLFKIRYLDYFVTIEDNNVSDKTIEEPIEKNLKQYVEQKKERVIIRDPKHATLSFVNGLGKIALFLIKLFLLFTLIPIILCFIFLIFFTIVSICHVKYNIIFLLISIGILGCCVINYTFIELFYNFIVNKKENFKRFFFLCIIGLIMIGVSSGLSFVKGINFKYIESSDDLKHNVDTKYIDMKDNTIIHGYLDLGNLDYEIDNSLSNIKLEISCMSGVEYQLQHSDNNNYDYYSIHTKNLTAFTIYQYVLNDLKRNEIRSYNSEDFIKVKIYLNQENYNKLINNYETLYE